jgi:hypothetical protein
MNATIRRRAPTRSHRTSGSGAHKTCSSAFVHGVIGGQEKCLHAGELCAARYKRQYVRYGFRCVAGRLR